MRGVLATGMAIGLLILTGACGSRPATSAAGPAPASAAEPTPANAAEPTPANAADNPRDAGYACSLLTREQIVSVTGGPARDATHLTATVANGEAITTCSIESVAPCPQNLPTNSPYCPGAYLLQWTVDAYDNSSAALAGFAISKLQGSTPVTDIGADQAVEDQQPRSLSALKGNVLIQVEYIAPGGVSGNPGVLPTAPPIQGPGLHKLARMILSKVG
jgi:hypothetical protein